LLHRTGFTVPYWYVLTMTGTKGLLLISFYNIQSMIEDPFNQNSPDGIRLNDFRFDYLPEPVVVIPPKEKVSKKEPETTEEEKVSKEEPKITDEEKVCKEETETTEEDKD
jgi:hypothetical protein